MNKKYPLITSEYITQLASALKKRGVKDVDDILTDYRDYFTQSKAKGYSDTESINRLPTPAELAASYDESSGDLEPKPMQEPRTRPSFAQRVMIFSATLAGDILLLPFVFIVVVMLACFTIVGMFLTLTGPLLLVPDTMLGGQLDVARPPLLQLVPTVLLFISAGITIVGTCMAIYERLYSALRASIVVRRWLLTGKHNNHLKLVPRVHKRLRILLYKAILITGLASLLLLLTLASFSWFTEGTINFPATWNL